MALLRALINTTKIQSTSVYLAQCTYLWDVRNRRLAIEESQIIWGRWFSKAISGSSSTSFYIAPIRDICCSNHQCKVTNRIDGSSCYKLVWCLQQMQSSYVTTNWYCKMWDKNMYRDIWIGLLSGLIAPCQSNGLSENHHAKCPLL